MSKCCILGLGYIGLPTAAVLAQAGHNVLGVDINEAIVSSVNRGQSHIIEPDLDNLLTTSVSHDLISASTQPTFADVFIITVPTPLKPSSPHPRPDTDFVFAAIRSIIPYLQQGNLVIIESTCPVGTTDSVADYIFSSSPFSKHDLHLAYCPERVLPGNILHELVHNDRVIGGLTSQATRKAVQFYSTFCEGTLHSSSSRMAEFVKLAENSYRDVNIAYANELSLLCHDLGLDVWQAINLSNLHPRVNILRPGCGVGGHCIAVDPWFLSSANPLHSKLIQTSRHVNDNKSLWVLSEIGRRVELLVSALGRPPVIGCLGLAFKPDVDDLRESPALLITTELIKSGYEVLVCEPHITEYPLFPLHSLEHVCANADLLVLLVGHSSFRQADLAGSSVFDLCGLLSDQPSA